MQNNNFNNQKSKNNQSTNCKDKNGKSQVGNRAKNDCGKGDAHPNSDKQNDKYLK